MSSLRKETLYIATGTMAVRSVAVINTLDNIEQLKHKLNKLNTPSSYHLTYGGEKKKNKSRRISNRTQIINVQSL